MGEKSDGGIWCGVMLGKMALPSKSRPGSSKTELRLLMPADPLTRLMMDADKVSVSEMEVLMRRVSSVLAKRSTSGSIRGKANLWMPSRDLRRAECASE